MTASLLFASVFLHALLVTFSADETFDCTGFDDESLHPVDRSEDCRDYWQCVFVDTAYMSAVKRLCPAGTLFDSDVRACEIDTLVSDDAPHNRFRMLDVFGTGELSADRHR